MSGVLENRRVIVTGGNGGIGQGIARGMVDAGATVAIVGRKENVAEVARELSEPGREAIGLQADLSDRSQLKTAFEQAVAGLGGLDVLVNSHGIARVDEAAEHSLDQWDETIETNLTSVFELCQLAGRHMLAQGSGKIINIASMYFFFGGLKVIAYTASKGGLAQLTKALSNEWAPHGINVNAIAPGYVKTNLNEHVWGDPVRSAEIMSRVPYGRWAEPVDMAGPSVFLASPASDYIHGVILPVDGGFMAR
ncbi:MAG: SDR family oxidoreductase [Acidimicrobiia bacterium]|nr:SDR family oxidoreductase [Acidimicrobiia bacterium]